MFYDGGFPTYCWRRSDCPITPKLSRCTAGTTRERSFFVFSFSFTIAVECVPCRILLERRSIRAIQVDRRYGALYVVERPKLRLFGGWQERSVHDHWDVVCWRAKEYPSDRAAALVEAAAITRRDSTTLPPRVRGLPSTIAERGEEEAFSCCAPAPSPGQGDRLVFHEAIALVARVV